MVMAKTAITHDESHDAMSDANNILLRVNSIEVIYNHVILVLKGAQTQS